MIENHLKGKGIIDLDIYLVRHAEAIERTEGLDDELRYLTRKGRIQAAKQAKNLKKKIRPELIVTSPLVRAVQTAELLALKVGKGIVVTAHSCLGTDAEAEQVIDMINDLSKLKSIMLVGHEPQLSRVAALLLGFEHVAPLHKGGCMALSWKPKKCYSNAIFKWYTINGKKLATTARKVRIRKTSRG